MMYDARNCIKAIIEVEDWNIIGTTINRKIRMGVLCLVFVMAVDLCVMVFIIKMYLRDKMVPIVNI